MSFVGYNYRWAPVVQYARQFIQDGKLGDLTHYRGRFFCMYGSNPYSVLSWRFLRDVAGLGTLGDLLSQRLRVIIPDRPGQGYSVTGTGPVASPAYQVTLIREVLRHLRASGPLIVVGHSFGGLIALRYALDNPDTVAGLVLINPTTHPRPQGLPLFQRAAEVLMKPLVTYTLLPPLSRCRVRRRRRRQCRQLPCVAASCPRWAQRLEYVSIALQGSVVALNLRWTF